MYTRIEMSQYLQANDTLEIEEQKKIFEIRNKMTNIPANFSGTNRNERKCVCEEPENMAHIYLCKKLNITEIRTEFENMYKGNVKNMSFV